MEGEGIEHRTVEVNGIKMHIAEKGDGPVVLFIHGFPELWYSWRHQILSLAAHGYRAVAPDLRGYGDTDAPLDVATYTIMQLVGDLVGLIHSLGQEQVFVVGHDWGALVAWHLCLFRPDLVKAVVNLSVPFIPPNPTHNLIDYWRVIYGDDFYVCRFQLFLICLKPGPLIIPKDKGLLGAFDEKDITLPSWLCEEDINYFTSKFNLTGFTGGFNYYRNLNKNTELTAPWMGAQVKVPAKYIVGDLDLVYHFAGMKDYIHGGGLDGIVPSLEMVVLEGVGHFSHQERPEEISDHIYEFIKRF
ncbi:hypothetical protein HPP92_000120 [Vanilla planifolia]|uniref:AB hydrolase-1 domain-containing protein n=1 Tax=Vanilla planifolia TaxID=51239 RepID=A0A835VK83_VANPL|nr:hypothetical protein HPP92_000120 [Vanilla planifolia]